MAFLSANNGPESGKKYELKGTQCVLGRHPDCEIVVDVGAVSRQHAKIYPEGPEFYVQDLNSRNHTFVNDIDIFGLGPRQLTDGDLIRICEVAFTYHGEKKAPPSPDPTRKTAEITGMGTVVIDDGTEEGPSTIMSKFDVSSSHGRVQLTASPEAKLSALVEITRSLGKALALNEVLPQVLNSLFKIFVQADRSFIVMRAEDGQLVPLATKVRRENAEDTIRVSRTIVNHVMQAKEAILSADAASDQKFEMSQSIADFRIRAMMCAPLLDTEGKAMGVLQIDTLDQRKRFQKEDLEVLASVAAQAGIAIDNAQMHERALKQKAHERDLEVAHEVQKSFLPEKPPEVEGYQFFNYYQPANHVGGDYFDYIGLKDGRWAVIVADVVGHGVAAALLMAKLSAESRYCLASEPNPATAVTRLNETMSRLQLDRFVTFIMVVIDPLTHEAVVVNAGHMAPIHRMEGGKFDEPGEELSGMPIGIMEGIDFEQHAFPLKAGELLLLYTDGVNECTNMAGDMYGIDRIREMVGGAELTPEAVGQKIVTDVRKFIGAKPPDDDMCLVCIGRT